VSEYHNPFQDIPQLNEVEAPWFDEIIGDPPTRPLAEFSLLTYCGLSHLLAWLRLLASFEVFSALWVGSAGSRTQWHRDSMEHFNVLLHFQGTKNVSLLHDTSGALRPIQGQYYNKAVFGDMDRWDPDCAAFPEYCNADIQSFMLHPGDVLLIPRGWWHAVESLNTTISLSVRYHWCLDWWLFGSAWQALISDLHNGGWYLARHGSQSATHLNESYDDWDLPA